MNILIIVHLRFHDNLCSPLLATLLGSLTYKIPRELICAQQFVVGVAGLPSLIIIVDHVAFWVVELVWLVTVKGFKNQIQKLY